MISFKRILNHSLIFSLLLSCNENKPSSEGKDVTISLATFKWMQGAWEGGELQDRFFQFWNIVNDSLITGENLIVMQNDTLFYQNIQILKKGNTIIYKTEPKWMYEHPYSYRIKVNSNGEHVFEDTRLEFPQRVILAFNEDGSLYYRLEGTIDGQTSYEDFTLYKME